LKIKIEELKHSHKDKKLVSADRICLTFWVPSKIPEIWIMGIEEEEV
jgi:hypothetical protein